MVSAEATISGLNSRQRQAVERTDGPLLILAGPGSGKTRVIAHRIAYLVKTGVMPWRILSVTFTNKAAREMRERVVGLVSEDVARDMQMGTFHAICARVLRSDGQPVGVPPTFAIFDRTDQISAVKQAMAGAGVDPKKYAPASVLSAISRAKAELQTAESYSKTVGDYFEEVVARVYSHYQELLRANSALDFDDLIMETVRLYREREDVLKKHAGRYLYVHVDEFQDTSVAQYALAKQWASLHSNICVVGDPDQSIYSWRSADIRNILDFERDFPAAEVVLLEQNYRSTRTILDAARHVIAANAQRKEKRLWTENGLGFPLTVHEGYNEEDEADYVAREISSLLEGDGALSIRQIAVMYRTNAQSRPFEDVFVRRKIPYRLVGGVRFYERREVKDLLAYLRLALNPSDSVALLRIINVPTRGVGQKTIAGLTAWADEEGLTVHSALQSISREESSRSTVSGPRQSSGHPFKRRTTDVLLRFLAIVDEVSAMAGTEKLSDLLDTVIARIDYRRYVLDQPDGEERWENVQELRSVASQYDGLKPSDALASFLEDVALITDVDDYDEQAEAVTLITLHAAKGLEFSTVFIVGLEEGVLPHHRAIDDPDQLDQLEEERRLCYVGMTRARRRLYLVRAFRRAFGGHNSPSRFLSDIPSELLTVSGQPSSLARGRAGVSDRYRGALAEGDDSPLPEKLAAGDRVRHPKFGEGIVVACQPRVGDQIVTVAFRGDAGVKKLLLGSAPLERLAKAP